MQVTGSGSERDGVDSDDHNAVTPARGSFIGKFISFLMEYFRFLIISCHCWHPANGMDGKPLSAKTDQAHNNIHVQHAVTYYMQG